MPKNAPPTSRAANSTGSIEMPDSTERYQLPEQLRMAAGAVRDYVRNEIVPLEQQIPHDSIHLPKEEYDRLVPDCQRHGHVVHGGAIGVRGWGAFYLFASCD